MDVRGLLRRELWSKETTRKMFAVAPLVVAACVVWVVVNEYWLTSGERRIARTALSELERLEQAGKQDESSYQAELRRSDECVDEAERAAVTSRDRRVAHLLSDYELLLDVDRSSELSRIKLSASPNAAIRDASKDTKTQEQAEAVRRFLRQTLLGRLS